MDKEKIKNYWKKLDCYCKKNFKRMVWFVITIYVVLNWEKCVRIKYLSEFNGDSILFICWILMNALEIYDLTINGWNLREKKQELEQKHSEFKYLEDDEAKLKFMQEKQNIENTMLKDLERDKRSN